MIIQDTPTRVPPWTQPIQVPHLKGFSRLYRGLSKREGIVSVEDVYRDIHESLPMHARGVTLSSIYADMMPLTDETMLRIKNQTAVEFAALFLPSLMRDLQVLCHDCHGDKTQEYRENRGEKT